MNGRNLINGSVKWIGVPRLVCDDELPWTANILVPIPRWGVGGTFENLAWGSQPSGRYSGVDVPWRGAAPARPAYLPWSLENACSTVRRVRDNLLREHCLARAQSLSNSRHILRDELFNRMDCALDDIWDKPAPQ